MVSLSYTHPRAVSQDFKMHGPNGTNGINGVSASSVTVTSSEKRHSFRSSSMNSMENTPSISAYMRNTAQSLEKKGSADLGAGVFESVLNTSFIDLVEYIGKERLQSLPHKGGRWDRVLIRALYLAEQQNIFEKMMKSFGADDSGAANIGYGFCRLLLELGHENALALEKAFAVLYKYALEVADLLHRTEVVTTTPSIREQLCLLYGDLLTLTSAVGTRYYKSVYGMATPQVSLDMNDVCGGVVESFGNRQNEIAELIWSHQAQLEGVDMERVPMKTLHRWLGPNDPVVSSLTQNHTFQLGGQAELTGLWFQKPLSNFLHSDSKIMAVTGEAGSGKSLLAASVVERLQRPLGRQAFSTLYHSISNSVPSAATKIDVLKSLLARILKLRLGNMQTYRAIAHAFEDSQLCADPAAYETHLWTALEEALKKPLDHARDLVVVVDGLDELQGGQATAQSFFERLAETVSDGKRVKLIGFSRTLSMPSGMNTTHLSIAAANVHDDIHAVVLKALMHCRHLTTKPGPEQEQIIDKVVRTAGTSFVWAILAAQWISGQTSPDDFTKAIDNVVNSKVPVQELVQRLVSRAELPAQTKVVLAWLLNAERPLSVRDIRTLLTTGTHEGNNRLEKPDVHSILQLLDPLLYVDDGIVRFKHADLRHVIHTLADSGKIVFPAETGQTDLLLRSLTYARLTLQDDVDPTFDEYDYDQLERSLQEYPFLGYVLQHWITHVRKTPEQKRPKDLSSVFPNTALLPLMERTFWIPKLPLSQYLDRTTTALQIYEVTLKQLSPALLQGNINTAAAYEMIGRPVDAAALYYSSLKTSRNLLSNYHPLPLEIGFRYLDITGSNVESTRTERTTRREEVFGILIALLERQYGKTSSRVIEIRTQLALFYEHIHEESRATEIYQSLHHDVAHTHGKDSTQARDIFDRVTLSGSRPGQAIHGRDSIFDDEDDKQDTDTFDIATIDRHLHGAKTERDFAMLWQKLSTFCRTTASLDYHEKNIDVALAYSKFLVAHKRSREASAVLTSVAREYETNQVSFSDQIVSRLINIASFTKQIGEIALALSILKHASYVYESLKQQESTQFLEIQQQISTVSFELIEKSDAEASGDLLEQVFRSSIQDESKPVDHKTISIGITLVTQHMGQFRLTRAIEIIRLILHRTWPSFLAAPPIEIVMTATFPKESIQVVEYLAECFFRQKRQEDADQTLLKLFHASLTPSTIDFALVKRVEQRLIEQYDKYHKLDKAIVVLQKVLPARKTSLGPTHDDTIKTLYELGRRSHTKARFYPFWMEYYQQVVTSLNKDATICHPKAMDAAIIVANAYWEDSRYSDAVPVFALLWQTFKQKPKEYSQFSQVEVVERLYARYYQSLEEVGTRFDTLYQITIQYRNTCTTIFGAQAAVTLQATLDLARVCQSNDDHASEALEYYEEAYKHSHGSSEAKGEINIALTTLYQVVQSAAGIKSETLERARIRSMEQYQAAASHFGYSHRSTLVHLHELVLLYSRQKNTAAITKELTTAITEIIKKETSSVMMVEAAESIVQSFQASHTVEYCVRLLTELHKQVLTKDSSSSATFGIDVTKSGRSVLSFLAAMRYHLTTDKTASFSQLLAELTLEALYYDDYHHLIKSNASLQDILLSASNLRAFLGTLKKQEQITNLDEEMGALFITRDGAKIKLLSKESSRLFMQAIMEYCGTRHNTSFVKAIILSSNVQLQRLMETERYAEAYDIGRMAFEFALENNGYNGPRGISYGFKLATTIAGIDFSKKCSDADLRTKMLRLSNDTAKKMIDVCKKQQIEFAEIQLGELNRLVVLLGEQEDYETLEWLLTTLWSTREAQRSWDSDALYNLGKRLISSRFLAGHPIKALRLCEDITYNMRRTHGMADPTTGDMNVLLAQLYTSVGQWYLQNGTKDKSNVELANQYFAKAIAVHEETLRYCIDEDGDGLLGDDEDLDSTGVILAEHGITLSRRTGGQTNGHAAPDVGMRARKHIDLLKYAYQRLGSWPKSHADYERLIHQVQDAHPSSTKGIQAIDKWQVKGFGSGKAESDEGVFKKDSWHLMSA